MAHLAMFVTRVGHLRVTELRREHVPALVGLVQDMEMTYFGRSETNEPEVFGTLKAPELHGTRGTAGLWDGDRLIAALLAYDALEHEQGLFLDLFVRQGAQRQQNCQRLVCAAREYGATLKPRPGDWLKVETFAGDVDLSAGIAADGFAQHRVYLRMRRDFHAAPARGVLPEGLTARGMTADDWPAIHRVITEAFADHYDFHPLPLELTKKKYDDETTDYGRWQLVFDGPDLLGIGISSNRYAVHRLGYVDTLAVLRHARGRGIATYLLHEAFAQDHARGFTGTALHCDATNPTGAARLYETVGMHRDQHYDAWRAPLR